MCMYGVGQSTLPPQGSTRSVNNVSQTNTNYATPSTGTLGVQNLVSPPNQTVLPSTSITPRTQQSETTVNSFPGNAIQIPAGEVGHVTDPANVILEITYGYDHQTQLNQQTPGETKLLQAIVTAQNNVIPTSINTTNAIPQSVKRFAINPLSVFPGTPTNPYILPADHLHHIEHFILQQALAKLNTVGAVVIMDIFVLDKTTRAQCYATFTQANGATINIPETHSVVLWKKDANTLVLIDPSNVTFSARLKAAYPNYKGNITAPTGLSDARIPGKVIYNGGPQTVPRGYSDVDIYPPQARDCIDIAVKIAFEIQVQIGINTPIENIEKAVYGKVSNQMKLNTSLRPKKNGELLRGIQSSISGLRTWIPILTVLNVENLITQLQQSSSMIATSSGATTACSSAPPPP